ncbi:Hypothetical protein FKW44_012855, partial [Caligus rogercresseyi]
INYDIFCSKHPALSLKIPNINGPTWNYGFDVVRHFPSLHLVLLESSPESSQ